MSWTIIVASSDSDQLAELKQGADEIAANIRSSGGSAGVLEAASVEDVRRLRGGPHDTKTELVIATALLAESPSAPKFQNLPGLNFVKELQAATPPPACILVSERLEHTSEIQGMARCKLLIVNASTSYIDDCILLANELDVWTQPKVLEARPHGPEPPIPAPGGFPGIAMAGETYALVEVEIPDDVKSATVRRIIKRSDRTLPTPTTPLGFNPRKIDALIDDSRKLSERFSRTLKSKRKYEVWKTDYQALGERFFKLLNTTAFRNHLTYAKGAAEPAGQHVRLRFSLGRRLFDGLWESIFDPTTGRHLMLDSAITRRDRESIDDFPDGGEGGGILNILVIGSTLDDNSEPVGPDDPLWKKYQAKKWKWLEALPHVDQEVAKLKALETRPVGPAGLRVEVDVRSGTELKRSNGTKPWSLAEIIKKELKDNPGRYDVIHFAGHALFAAQKRSTRAAAGKRKVAADERGYLVFSGSPNPQAVPIAEVADWLKNTSVELVYLSCCRSSAAQAASELARNSIRTTIGFRWDLDDVKAVAFAELFYEGLLGNRLNVCSAIREARDKLYNHYNAGDPIWASPVLLAQPQEWRHVEGVLRPPVRP